MITSSRHNIICNNGDDENNNGNKYTTSREWRRWKIHRADDDNAWPSHLYQTIKIKVFKATNQYLLEVIVQFINLSLFVKQEMYSLLWCRRHLDLGQNWVTWIIWLQWRHMRSVASQITGNSPVFVFFPMTFFRTQKNTKASYYCPFVRDCTSDRWYKEPITRKMFSFPDASMSIV